MITYGQLGFQPFLPYSSHYTKLFKDHMEDRKDPLLCRIVIESVIDGSDEGSGLDQILLKGVEN